MTRAPHVDSSLAGRHALVLGLGRFSGGVETIRFLTGHGAHVVVSDSSTAAALAESVRAIDGTGATLRFGPQTPALLDDVGARGLVVASPAIPFDHPVLVEAARRGIEVTSEIELTIARLPCPVLGVTGTKGKSTTSTLLANMLRASGVRTHLGGNVGRSLLNEWAGIRSTDRVVLELSSFQLHDLRRISFRPSIAVVTNLFPDHLDRHGTFAHYAASKRSILEAQTADDVAVLPARDPALVEHGFETAGRARRVRFGGVEEAVGEPGVRVRPDGGLTEVRAGASTRRPSAAPRADAGVADGTELPAFALWGAHNRRNAAAAAAAARAAGCTWAEIRAGAAATRPLPHRLEPVHESGDVLFIDDSIATTPQCTAAALEAVPRRCIVLVGGKDKAVAPTALVAALAARAKGVVGIGTTGRAVVEGVRAASRVPAVLSEGGPDLEAAVRAALAMAAPGDAILLSPGYSSLDQYLSFAVRGDTFAAAARAATATR